MSPEQAKRPSPPAGVEAGFDDAEVGFHLAGHGRHVQRSVGFVRHQGDGVLLVFLFNRGLKGAEFVGGHWFSLEKGAAPLPALSREGRGKFIF